MVAAQPAQARMVIGAALCSYLHGKGLCQLERYPLCLLHPQRKLTMDRMCFTTFILCIRHCNLVFLVGRVGVEVPRDLPVGASWASHNPALFT